MKTDFPNLKYAVAELPAGPSGKATLAFSVCYGVAKASPNKAAAIDFVRFLTSSEQQLAFTKDFPVMPSRKSLSEQWLTSKPELRAFVSGADYAKKAVFIPGFAPVVDSMNDGIQGLAAGDRTVDQVVTATQQAGQDVLKKPCGTPAQVPHSRTPEPRRMAVCSASPGGTRCVPPRPDPDGALGELPGLERPRTA
jgi:multiple sugar transport system substrate-binding protein